MHKQAYDVGDETIEAKTKGCGAQGCSGRLEVIDGALEAQENNGAGKKNNGGTCN